MKILGIETSCDESAAALLELKNKDFKFQKNSNIFHLKLDIHSNLVLSQIDLHKKYGGIVPEVAARQHVSAVLPIIEQSLGKSKPDLIAVTQGPGLITSLQIGLQTAKTLAYVWGVPLVGVNHLEAHLWSFLLNSKSQISYGKSRMANNKRQTTYNTQQFPAIGLIVSGGHTEIVLVKGVGKYQLLGRTRDDAVGEAFDKVAKMLEIGYPGGPIISHFGKKGDSHKISFPRPMLESRDFDFSFSGLKTAVKNYLASLVAAGGLSQSMINDICASFQQAAVEVLTYKTIRAAEKYQAKAVILGGGVSANEELIKDLASKTKNIGIDFYYPDRQFTGDNAAMVALAGYFNIKKASCQNWRKLVAEANLKLV